MRIYCRTSLKSLIWDRSIVSHCRWAKVKLLEKYYLTLIGQSRCQCSIATTPWRCLRILFSDQPTPREKRTRRQSKIEGQLVYRQLLMIRCELIVGGRFRTRAQSRRTTPQTDKIATVDGKDDRRYVLSYDVRDTADNIWTPLRLQ